MPGSILAGFPEPAYISGLLGLAWGVYRLDFRTRALGYGKAYAGWLRIRFDGCLAAADRFCRLPASIGLFCRPQQDRVVFAVGISAHDSDALCLWTLEFPCLLQVLIDTWGNIGGYTGPLVLVMALIGVMRKSADRGLRLLLLIWVLLCWARTFGVQPFTAIIDHLPLLSRAVFCRYAGASWILALTILAAYGLDEFRGAAPRRRGVFAIVMVLLLVCVAVAWPQRAFWGWSQGKLLVMFAFLGAAVFWALAGLAALGLAWRISHLERRRTIHRSA